ncbi:MAG: threonine synthase [Spartobacteria bacterium]|nr:threonine synthase [Spartobacteria bacterium]
MQYVSTRGETGPVGFQDVVLMGLASDGGLMVPENIPDVSDKLTAWSLLSYQELAFEVCRLFVDIPEDDLRDIIHRSYSTFRVPSVCPHVKIGPVNVLELFHGPTLAFKDVALQWLGNLFEYILERRGGHLNILAATSGDTGSAAIAGVRGKERIKIFVMHPYQRVSPVQERQMTSVLDDNVFNLAVRGTFDDCQSLMKGIFSDTEYKQAYSLGAVNSVNWARILAQIVYYFYSGLKVMRDAGADEVQFSVPTGNFGDILAGYYASRMGLPIRKLILATNENDILSRFFNTGEYSSGRVVPTYSPSMDIQVASNFERYLYHMQGNDPVKTAALMREFDRTKRLVVPAQEDGVDPLFAAGSCDGRSTLDTILCYCEAYDYLLDPHTATGVYCAEEWADPSIPVICLATAHPAKFGKAIEEATGSDLAHHEILDALAHLPTRCDIVDADSSIIRDYISSKA